MSCRNLYFWVPTGFNFSSFVEPWGWNIERDVCVLHAQPFVYTFLEEDPIFYLNLKVNEGLRTFNTVIMVKLVFLFLFSCTIVVIWCGKAS